MPMDIAAIISFALGMSVLALSPGPGLAAILSRSLVSGPRAGIFVVTGLVLVDMLFLGLAILGLSTIATHFGPLFQLVKYAAALYLFWLGLVTFKNANRTVEITQTKPASPFGDIGLGVIVTLGNPKAILFYSAILPTFFDVSILNFSGFMMVSLIIIITSFLVYGVYMLLAEQFRPVLTSSKVQKRLNQSVGTVYIGSGVLVASR